METITNDIIKQAAEIGGDNLEELFELFFRVHTGYDGSWELETWTDGGVNMIFYLDTSDKVSEFSSIVNNFDVDEEIDLHREDKRYQKAFTISESVEDFEGFKDWLFEVLDIIESAVYNQWSPDAVEEPKVVFLEDKLEAVLNQIASDLASLQNDPDESWTDSIRDLSNPLGIFYDRICASVTDFENLKR